MRLISADWIFCPSEKPLHHGTILFMDKKIEKIGQRGDMKLLFPDVKEEIYRQSAIVPGLINCHTHLELSGMGRIPAVDGYVSWVRNLLEKKLSFTDSDILSAAAKGALEAMAYGTTYAADTASNFIAAEAASKMGFTCTAFVEFLGLGSDGLKRFNETSSLIDEKKFKGIRLAPACHGPHSTSPDLFRAISSFSNNRDLPRSIHLAESEDEVDLLLSGKGEFPAFLNARGIDDSSFPKTGVGPVEYVNRLGFLTSKTLAVHLVQADEEDLHTIKIRDAIPVICPSSNLYLTGKLPMVSKMIEMDLKPCLGTDSPASGDSLNLFNEMKILIENGIKENAVLKMATINGAGALDLDRRFGRIEPGVETDLLILPIEPDEPPLRSAISAGAKGLASWLGGDF